MSRKPVPYQKENVRKQTKGGTFDFQASRVTASSWSALLLCSVVFLYLAIVIPNVISQSVVHDREKHVQEIRSSTDLHQVQEIAAWRTEKEAYITDSASMLLTMSVVTMLLCMICSGISLIQIRRLRRELHDKSAA